MEARTHDRGGTASSDGWLDWSYCVATVGRQDILLRSLRLALRQTRPPREIVIVDAGENWEETRERVRAEIGDGAIGLIYHQAHRKSLTVQRNQAIAAASSDILVMFDDDSLMHPDCAERIMEVYETDVARAVSGVAARHDKSLPDEHDGGAERSTVMSATGSPPAATERKGWFSRNRHRIEMWRRASPLFRWVMVEVMLMAMNKMFVPYDARCSRAPHDITPALRGLDVSYQRHLPGYGLTVRREIAVQEPFDPHPLAYCPNEDLDASYRWGRYGVTLICTSARLHHFEAASGRIKRNKATILAVTNVAFFIRKHSDAFRRHVLQFYVLMTRRLLAETMKDLIMGRMTLPQSRGVVEGLALSVRIFRLSRPDIGDRYVDLQSRLLAR